MSNPGQKRKVLVTGALGFIGSSTSVCLENDFDVALSNHNECNLENYDETYKLLEKYEPCILVNAAGRAAGIQGNLNNSTELLEINARIALNISKAAHELGVKHVIQFASACVYPLNDRKASQPSDLGKGIIEESSKSYAMSKLLAIEIFSAYRKQYENQWVTIIPSNLYGAGDWNHGSNGHVASMLLERFFEARKNSLQEVTVWGDGQSLRNFLNVQDLAKAVKFVIDNEIWDEEVINVCGEPEISIEQLTQLIAQTTGYTGNVLFDETKPNGARRKMLDDSCIRSFGWSPTISLEDGFAEYYKSYLDNL